MNAEQFGRKIREARLEKKMTQAEVVGDYITRNMLSLIESGAAMPSMSTLKFLAERLDIPLPQLLGEDAPDPLKQLLAAKEALRHENWEETVRLLGEPEQADPLYDEYCALLARAYRGKAAEGSAQSAALADYYEKLGLYKKG